VGQKKRKKGKKHLAWGGGESYGRKVVLRHLVSGNTLVRREKNLYASRIYHAKPHNKKIAQFNGEHGNTHPTSKKKETMKISSVKLRASGA